MDHNPPPPNQQAYYESVWQLVRQIPPGQVATYGQIAQLVPPPADIDPREYKARGPRWVGRAMAACPDDVPWQRVINAQGKVSERPGVMRQRQLLEEEGVVFLNESKLSILSNALTCQIVLANSQLSAFKATLSQNPIRNQFHSPRSNVSSSYIR